jgi:hypothetical protein
MITEETDCEEDLEAAEDNGTEGKPGPDADEDEDAGALLEKLISSLDMQIGLTNCINPCGARLFVERRLPHWGVVKTSQRRYKPDDSLDEGTTT